MRIYLGSDHRGFELKEFVKEWLIENNYEVEDVGNFLFDPDDDYVTFALKVAESVEGSSDGSRGILLCGSGHGVDILANRFPHVRAILAYNNEVAAQGREHEDANILVIPSDWTTPEEASERLRIFFETEKIENVKYDRRRALLSNLQIRQS